MTLKMSFLVLGLPSLVYYLVQRRRARPRNEVLATLGLRGTPSRYLLIGAVVGAAIPLVVRALSDWGLVALDFRTTMSGLAGYATLPRTLATFLIILLLEGIGTALGEELLFRGLLGGVLMRRFGFVAGNSAQAALFGLSHLVVLLTAPQYAVFAVVFAFAAGLFLGWLRFRSGSILPPLLAHAIGFPVAAFVLLGGAR